MGCDISMLLQKKTKSGYKDVEIVDIHRDYELFGLLAGVRRGDIKPIVQQRGLPEDFEMISNKYGRFYHPTKLKYDAWDDQPGMFMGEHSYSWMTLQELHSHKWHKEEVLPEVVVKLLVNYHPLDKYRIVFGFDS